MHCVSTKATDYYRLTVLRLSDTSFAELPKLSEVEDLLPGVGVVDLLDFPLSLPILGTGTSSERLWQGVRHRPAGHRGWTGTGSAVRWLLTARTPSHPLLRKTVRGELLVAALGAR